MRNGDRIRVKNNYKDILTGMGWKYKPHVHDKLANQVGTVQKITYTKNETVLTTMFDNPIIGEFSELPWQAFEVISRSYDKAYRFNDLRDDLLAMEEGKEQINAAQMNELLSKLCQLVQGPNGDDIIVMLYTHKPSK